MKTSLKTCVGGFMDRRRPSEVECPFLVGIGYAALFWFAVSGIMGVFT